MDTSTDKILKTVSVVKGPSRYDNVKRALGLIRSDLEIVRNKKNVLIKPNLTATKNEFANTHPKAVEATIDFLLENFPELEKSRFTILEGSGSAYYEKTLTEKVFKDFGYFELIKKYKNVSIECIETFSEYSDLGIMSIAGRENVKILKRFFDFDFRISVAIPKVHNYAIATFGIKNMAGVIRQQDKSLLHGLRTPSAPNAKTVFTYIPTWAIAWMRRRVPNLVNLIFKKSIAYMKATRVIHQNVAALARITWPDLVVLDAFDCMDGNGPVDGFPVRLGTAIASTDALKADGMGARLLGLKPEEVGYLYYLQAEGRGDYSVAGAVGEKIEAVGQKFKLHPTYNIQKNWKLE